MFIIYFKWALNLHGVICELDSSGSNCGLLNMVMNFGLD